MDSDSCCVHPIEATEALPLFRGIILDDKKGGTCLKKGLLRVLVQISLPAGGLAEIEGDETVHRSLGPFAYLLTRRLY